MPIGDTNIICSDCLGIDKTCFQRKYFFLYSFCGIEIEKGQEKQALIVMLVIALVMFLLLNISSVFSAVQDSTFLIAMEEYGAFYCIYCDLEEQHFAQLPAGKSHDLHCYLLPGEKYRGNR